ncbi:MAG TPA: ATP-binding protein [Burkholderiaceae bacterium]|nr:ATP-binding protein [Burkholderiaceae bacterium]
MPSFAPLHRIRQLAARVRAAVRLRWPAASLGAYWVIVIVIATVPMALFVSYLVYRETLAARTQLEEGLRRTANAFSLAVERELVSSIDALSILAYSESLQRHDVPRFYRTLTRWPTLRTSWQRAFLVAADGKVLFSTDRPLGAPMADLAGSVEFERLRTLREPVVSDLSWTYDELEPATSIQVPVIIDGQLRYVLGAVIPASNWQKLMGEASVPSGGFISLFDGNSRIIAHSLQPDTLVGAELPEGMQPRLEHERQSVQSAPYVGSGSTYAAWQRVPLAGWGVGVGVEAGPLKRAHLRAVGSALGAGALSLSIGLALALVVARQVTGPLRQLARMGPDAVTGNVVVREIAALRDALHVAAEQRELARQRLQAKADEFEALFNGSPIGLVIAQDPSGQSTLMNPALAAMLNAPPRPWGEEDPEKTVPPGTPPRVLRQGRELPPREQPVQRACTHGVETRDLELDVVYEDGRTINVLAYAVPLRAPDGRPRGAIGAFVDITERKQAEQRLIQAERRLRESQNLVELAQEAGHVGFFDYHFHDDVAVWTSGLAKLFGIELREVEPGALGWTRRVVPEDARRAKLQVADAVARHADRATFEFRAIRPDGSIRWLAGRALLTYDEAGQPWRMVGVCVDATDQKLVEQERAAFVAREQAARREAENANRAKDEFLAMLGHELRNPLGAIAAAVEVLNRVGNNQETAASARRIIARQASHLARLMNDLLDMARATAGKITLSRQALNLAQLVQRTLSAMEVAGSLRQHKLSVEYHDAWVEADAMRMEQVVTNLVTNATKYTPPDGAIHVRVAAEEGAAVLEVRDTGIGLSPELLPRIFDLFVQGERALDRRQGGLGIGLTLVRRLVELHGGHVSAHSEGPNRGSTFTVRLPRVQPPASVLALTPVAGSTGRHVVVVEDNDDARSAIESLLALAGHRVSSAEDGEAGLRLLLQENPDLALVDIGLPGLNGYEIAQRVRSAGRATRLIALSGYGQPQDVERALAAGFDAHMVKPIDIQELQRYLG